jgi:hypothetical protein
MALSATTDGLYIVESDTGKVLWKSLGLAPRGCPSPGVSNGRIFYCPRANGMMYCFEPDNTKHAKGRPGLSKPVSVEGAISGIGNPAHIGIRLTQETFGDEAGWCVADPDGGGLEVVKPRGLEVFGTGKGPRTLRYRHCYASSHGQSDYCDDSEHDPSYYRQLQIYGGALEGKGGKTQIVWPTGSTWEIHSKDAYDLVDSGELAAAVIYKED